MSRKKADQSVYDGFGRRLTATIIEHGAKKALAKAAGVTPETVRTWCKGESLPDVQQLIFISEHTKRSIDWLLTGIERGAPSYSEDIQIACEDVKVIFEAGVPVVKEALKFNLAAFKHAVKMEVEKKEEIETLKGKVMYLEKMLNPSIPNSGTD